MSSKILIVDDSELVSILHSEILKKNGFSCSLAQNGSLALELLLIETYSLIITDINMPRMNGYELVPRIRNIPGYEATPIIVVSTEGKPGDVLKAMQLGANLYIVKPVSADFLLSSVKSFLIKG